MILQPTSSCCLYGPGQSVYISYQNSTRDQFLLDLSCRGAVDLERLCRHIPITFCNLACARCRRTSNSTHLVNILAESPSSPPGSTVYAFQNEEVNLLYAPPLSTLKTLLKYVLENKIFSFNSQIYQQ